MTKLKAFLSQFVSSEVRKKDFDFFFFFMQNWNIYLINHLVCEMSENMLMKYIKLMMFSEILVNAYCDLKI